MILKLLKDVRFWRGAAIGILIGYIMEKML